MALLNEERKSRGGVLPAGYTLRAAQRWRSRRVLVLSEARLVARAALGESRARACELSSNLKAALKMKFGKEGRLQRQAVKREGTLESPRAPAYSPRALAEAHGWLPLYSFRRREGIKNLIKQRKPQMYLKFRPFPVVRATTPVRGGRWRVSDCRWQPRVDNR